MRPLVVPLLVVAAVATLSSARAAPPKPKVYRACPGDLVWSQPAGACVCPGELHWDARTKSCSAECPPGKVQTVGAPPGRCTWLPRSCEPGKRWSELHDGCVVACPVGKTPNSSGSGCVPDPHNCPADTQWFESRKACLPFCAPGRSLDYSTATCVDDAALGSSPAPASPAPAPAASPAPRAEPVVKRSAPTTKSSTKRPLTPTSCPEGKEWKAAFDGCVPKCNDDEVLDFYGIACHSSRLRR